MARLARVVVAGIPHHITQRGNRRQEVFFRDEDYQEYLDLMSHKKAGFTRKRARTGAVTLMQRFGSALNLDSA